MSKWDAARSKGKDLDQSDQDRSSGARGSWQQSRKKEKSDQEEGIKHVKHVLTQKSKSFEEARKRGNVDEGSQPARTGSPTEG